MYYTYLLENQNDKNWYIGYSSNLRKRLTQHQSGQGGKTTSKGENALQRGEALCWKLIYYEAYLNIADAKGRERFLKSGSGRKYLKKQLINYLS